MLNFGTKLYSILVGLYVNIKYLLKIIDFKLTDILKLVFLKTSLLSSAIIFLYSNKFYLDCQAFMSFVVNISNILICFKGLKSF